jgi:hypothetical protein
MPRQAVLTLAGVALAACAHAAPPAMKKPSGASMPTAACDKTIGPEDAPNLKSILAELRDGAVLCLNAGTYRANLWIARSLTIRGTGRVVIDGGRREPTVSIGAHQLKVTIEGLTLQNGDGGAGGRGGNLWTSAQSEVVLRDVTLEHGRSDSNGGGGFLAHDGTLVLERCRIVDNSGRRAHAAIVNGAATVTLRDCLVADNGDGGGRPRPAIEVGEVATLHLERTTVVQVNGPALRVGTVVGSVPTVRAKECILGDAPVEIAAGEPAPRVEIANSALAAPLPAGVSGSGNVVGPLGLDAQHRPAGDSIAKGRGPRTP